MKRWKKPSSHSWCCFNYSPVPVCANKFEWDLWLRDLFSERKMQLLPVALTHISCLAPSHLNIWLQDPDTESSVCVGLPSVQITESPRKITVIIETKPATLYPSSSQQAPHSSVSGLSRLKPFTEMIKPSPSALPCPLPRLRSLGMLSEYLAFFVFTSSLLSRN